MALIDILIQPRGRTRILFDCRDIKPRPEDESRIEQAIAASQAAASMAATATVSEDQLSRA
jgi:hypothetical protein